MKNSHSQFLTIGMFRDCLTRIYLTTWTKKKTKYTLEPLAVQNGPYWCNRSQLKITKKHSKWKPRKWILKGKWVLLAKHTQTHTPKVHGPGSWTKHYKLKCESHAVTHASGTVIYVCCSLTYLCLILFSNLSVFSNSSAKLIYGEPIITSHTCFK